jgi:hypothetical protein
MTTITERLVAYKRGTGETWPEIRAWLTETDFPLVKRVPCPPTDIDGDDVSRSEAGTWDEVMGCRNAGLLTEAEYMEVLEILWQQAIETGEVSP